MKTCKNSLFALALSLAVTPVLALETKDAISGAATLHDTAIDALKGIKKFKPSDFSKTLGNTATRKGLANLANAKISTALELSKSAHLPVLSVALDAAESGAEALGNLYEGNITGAGTVALHSAVSKVTVAGGALAGGKLFAYVGAVAGAWVPVVGPVAGGVVGGVVGSVGGAVVSSVAIGSDAVKDWFSATTEGFFARDKAWYSNLARQNRGDFLAEQAQQAAIAKGEHEKARAAREYGYDVPAGSSDNSEIQFSAGRLPDVELPATAESDPGKSIPLLPSNATIDITTWVKPEASVHETYVIREGQVSANFNAPLPVTSAHYTSMIREATFRGSIKDNQLTGTWSNHSRSVFSKVSGCNGMLFTSNDSKIEFILNMDGSISGRIAAGSMSIRVEASGSDCVYKNGSVPIPEMIVQGRWKLNN